MSERERMLMVAIEDALRELAELTECYVRDCAASRCGFEVARILRTAVYRTRLGVGCPPPTEAAK